VLGYIEGVLPYQARARQFQVKVHALIAILGEDHSGQEAPVTGGAVRGKDNQCLVAVHHDGAGFCHIAAQLLGPLLQAGHFAAVNGQTVEPTVHAALHIQVLELYHNGML